MPIPPRTGFSVVRVLPLACALLMLAPGRVHAACEFDAGLDNVLESGVVRVGWSSSPAEIKVGEPFELQVGVCPSGASLRQVQANMPLHRHGMNYRPTIHPLGQGRWRVQGLVWHMSGLWQLVISVALPGQQVNPPVVLRHDVQLR